MTFQLLVKKKNRGEKESECTSNARGVEMRNGGVLVECNECTSDV
jgi:hypothetical protein